MQLKDAWHPFFAGKLIKHMKIHRNCIFFRGDPHEYVEGIETGDGRNPAPPGMYKTLYIKG